MSWKGFPRAMLLLLSLLAWLHATDGYACSNRLYSGQRLLVGQSICSEARMFIVYLSSSGYLIIKDKAASQEHFVFYLPTVPAPSEVSFHTNGSLVAISTTGQTYWSSSAGGSYLELQNDARLKLFSRNSTGQNGVTWSAGPFRSTTRFYEASYWWTSPYLIPGGLGYGQEFRISMIFVQDTCITFTDTVTYVIGANVFSTFNVRFGTSVVSINTRWGGTWKAEAWYGLGTGFVSGQVSDVVLWQDQSGVHMYSKRNPSTVYSRNDPNPSVPLLQYKYISINGPVNSPNATVDYTDVPVQSVPLAVCYNRLTVGETLRVGKKLCADDYVLRVQNTSSETGVVLEYNTASTQRMWYLGSTPTVQPVDPTLKLYPNGSLVVADASTGFWWSSNNMALDPLRHGQAAYMSLQSDGTVQMVSTNGFVTWFKAATSCSNRLYRGQRLFVGQSICSPNGLFIVYLSSNGYLIIKDLAATKEHFVFYLPTVPAPSEVSFHTNGSLVAISTTGQIYWSTNTSGAYLELQNDARLKLFGLDSSGQNVVTWSGGPFRPTTTVPDGAGGYWVSSAYLIPGGLGYGQEFRVSLRFLQDTCILFSDNVVSQSVGNIFAVFCVNHGTGVVGLNTKWNSVWNVDTSYAIGSSFPSGQVTDVVLWLDATGVHMYSKLTPSTIYTRNDPNPSVLFQQYKYLVMDEKTVYPNRTVEYTDVPVQSMPQAGDSSSSYLGCFIDRADQHDLRLETVLTPPLVSPSDCVLYCASLGYPLSAVHSGSKCLCDYSYGLYGHAMESDCSTPCVGNASNSCGGTNRTAVYRNYLGFNSPSQVNKTTLWAAAVSAVSSQQSNYPGSAAIGQVDWYPSTGPSVAKTWMPQASGQVEFLELAFSDAILMEEVFIYETAGAGSVVRISARADNNSEWRTLWNDTSTVVSGSRVFSPPIRSSSVVSALLRIEINCTAAGGQCAIDAVKVRGSKALDCALTWSSVDRFYPGSRLCSPNGAHVLAVEVDGRIVMDFGQWASGASGGITQYLQLSNTQLVLMLDNGTVAWKADLGHSVVAVVASLSDTGLLRVVDVYGIELWNHINGSMAHQIQSVRPINPPNASVLVDRDNSTCIALLASMATFSFGSASRGMAIPVTVVGQNLQCQRTPCGRFLAVYTMKQRSPQAGRWEPEGMLLSCEVITSGQDVCRFRCLCQQDSCEAVYLQMVDPSTLLLASMAVCDILIQA